MMTVAVAAVTAMTVTAMTVTAVSVAAMTVTTATMTAATMTTTTMTTAAAAHADLFKSREVLWRGLSLAGVGEGEAVSWRYLVLVWDGEGETVLEEIVLVGGGDPAVLLQKKERAVERSHLLLALVPLVSRGRDDLPWHDRAHLVDLRERDERKCAWHGGNGDHPDARG
jgi:hypothetical protein